MTYTINVLPSAEQDLSELVDWITDGAGPEVALAYINRIDRRIDRLKDFPGRGVDASEFGQGFRSLSFEKRLRIFYRVEDDLVSIYRVISVARDLDAL